MRRVAILTDYLPHYRAAFYERLGPVLAEHDVALTLLYGTAPEFEMAPGTGYEPAWGTWIDVRWLPVRGRHLQWHRRALRMVRGHDLVVSDQASRILVNYPLLAWSRLPGSWLRGPELALWGHGRSFKTDASGAAERVKSLVTDRVHWFFAYTDRSAELVAASGFPADRITSVRNAIDTATLEANAASITDDELAALRSELGIRSEHVAVFAGRIWSERRPEFLIAAAEAARRHLPDLEIVVVGEGDADAPVRAAAARNPWFHAVGGRFGREAVLHQRLASVMVMPAPVGLVAIDSLVLGLPMVTLEREDHGPEFEYLSEETSLILPAGTTPEAFGEALAALLADPDRVARLAAGCRTAAPEYSIDAMVRRFADGVVAALDAPRR